MSEASMYWPPSASMAVPVIAARIAPGHVPALQASRGLSGPAAGHPWLSTESPGIRCVSTTSCRRRRVGSRGGTGLDYPRTSPRAGVAATDAEEEAAAGGRRGWPPPHGWPAPWRTQRSADNGRFDDVAPTKGWGRAPRMRHYSQTDRRRAAVTPRRRSLLQGCGWHVTLEDRGWRGMGGDLRGAMFAAVPADCDDDDVGREPESGKGGSSTNGWDAWCTAQPLAHRDVIMHHHGHELGRS